MTNHNNKTLRPLDDRVLLEREEESSTGSIILPDSAKKKQETAIVRAIGPGKRGKDGQLNPLLVKEGDRVLIDKYSGQEITLDKREYTIVKADDIIAIVE